MTVRVMWMIPARGLTFQLTQQTSELQAKVYLPSAQFSKVVT